LRESCVVRRNEKGWRGLNNAGLGTDKSIGNSEISKFESPRQATKSEKTPHLYALLGLSTPLNL